MLVATGGTIASRATPDGYLADVTGAELLASLDPERLPAGVKIGVVDVGVRGSYALRLEDMQQIALAVHQASAEGASGIVVTHGTDSLEETAFLSDLVHDSDIPVVFTGAQLPFDAPDQDGPDNLVLALQTAAEDHWSGYGVLVAFAGEVWAARGVRKVQTTALSAFSNDRPVEGSSRSTVPGLAAALATGELPAVEVVATVPGSDGAPLRDALRRNPAGIVLQTLGMGNATTEDAEGVRLARAHGIPVLITSRVQHGPVRPFYGGGIALERAGAIFAQDLSTWQARIVLAAMTVWVNAQGERSTPERGEQVESALSQWLERVSASAN